MLQKQGKFGGLARSSPLLKVEEAAAAALVVIDEAVGGAAFKPRMLFSSRLLETASLLKIRRHSYLLQTQIGKNLLVKSIV